MQHFTRTKITLQSLGLLVALGSVSASVEAQRFGGYYYTGQQTIQFSGQNRVCKVYGLDFAKFDTSRSKIVDVKFPKGGICPTKAGKWNGDCCTVSYTNGTTQSAKPKGRSTPANPRRRSR